VKEKVAKLENELESLQAAYEKLLGNRANKENLFRDQQQRDLQVIYLHQVHKLSLSNKLFFFSSFS